MDPRESRRSLAGGNQLGTSSCFRGELVLVERAEERLGSEHQDVDVARNGTRKRQKMASWSRFTRLTGQRARGWRSSGSALLSMALSPERLSPSSSSITSRLRGSSSPMRWP